MLANALVGETEKPTNAELAAALGPAGVAWEQLLAELAQEEHPDA